ncbi:Chromosome (plasmid) partitioning protein ParB [hydrothermal vent metagenome]|uniref:Chromosome (Plasmid) partitioning protein ParB n=1 Tax=hydrothermal vent metagenome TaxID=652676 RepID=A0A3B1DSM4_9ZZZZ
MNDKSVMDLINLTKIQLSKTNPRKNFDEQHQEDLVRSVKTHGVLQPILLRPGTDTASEFACHFELFFFWTGSPRSENG